MTPRPTISAPRPLGERPRLRLPAGAWDSHCHVFGPHRLFPYVPGRSYTPHDVPADQLLALHRELGFEHAVLVQAAAHGLDHSALLDALRRSDGRYRGVMLVADDASELNMEDLTRQGMRGVRYNLVPHLGAAPDRGVVRAVAARIAPFGWHIGLHAAAAQIGEIEDWLDLGVPIVLDHMGRLDLASPDFARDTGILLDLLEHPRFHIKLSAADRLSRTGAPYDDAILLAQRLFAAAPGKCLWGTDYPHPNHNAVPDDSGLVDLIARIAPTPAGQAALLVENPLRLYR